MPRHFRDELPAGDPFPVAAGVCKAKMDQNESYLDLPADLKDEISARLRAKAWTRYPQPQEYHAVKREFALSLGVEPQRLALTNGCDGAIQGIHFLSGGSGRKGLCFAPTYPMLSHAALLAGTKMTIKDIGPDYNIEDDFSVDYNLILIANPNNPTGSMTADETIDAALQTGAMVFIDEAYFDFSNKTWINSEIANLSIGRSCSKAMLAGIRLGALIADPQIISRYEALVTAPYHLSHLQLIVAELYHQILPYVREIAASISLEKKILSESMRKLKIKIFPSETNFILFEIAEAQSVFEKLFSYGVKIRSMTKLPGLNSHLRVTVGSHDQNRFFLDVLEKIICV